MPPCLIQNQNDELLLLWINRFRKALESRLHPKDIDSWQQQVLTLSCLRLDKDIRIQPLVFPRLLNDGPLSLKRPLALQDGLEAKPSLVLNPQGTFLVRIRRLGNPECPSYFFMKTPCSSGEAAFAFFGRGI